MHNAVRTLALAPRPVRLAAPVLLAFFSVVAHESSILAEVGVVAAAAGAALVAATLGPAPGLARTPRRRIVRTTARGDDPPTVHLVRLRH